jgi:glutathione S-transferase
MMATKAVATFTLKVTRLISAPRERVFDAWTSAEEIARWFGPGDQVVKLDLRVGGTYRGIKPSERLVFAWAWERDGSGPDFGEVELNEKFASVETRDRHERGWTAAIANLAQFVEGK